MNLFLQNVPYEVNFDYIALLLISAVWFVQFFSKDFPSRTNQVYSVFVRIAWISTVFDIISAYTINDLPPSLVWLNYFICIAYNVTLHVLPCIYYIYIVLITHEQQELKTMHRIFIYIPLLFNILSVVTTPLTHFVFYFNADNVYSYGFGMYIIYFNELLYALILSPIEIIRHRTALSKMQLASAVLYTVILVSVTLMQFLNPHLLIINLGIAISLFVFRITLRNPLEFIDKTTGAYNNFALREYFFTAGTVKKHSSIGMVQITNAEALAEQFGWDHLYSTIVNYLDLVKENCGVEYFFSMFQDCFIFIENSASKTEEAQDKIKDFTSKAGEDFSMLRLKYFILKDIHDITQDKKNSVSVDIEKLSDILRFVKNHSVSNNGTVYTITEGDIALFHKKNHIARRVSQAIKDKDFEVYLQPIYNIHTDTFISAESLIRLRDDDGEFIAPDMFIPDCELNGKILEIGDISLEKTCEFINKGHLRDLGITKVNINLSVVQCMQNNISSHLLSILDKHNIPYDMIRFEITESFMEHNSDQMLKVMNELASKDIEFALDDYGTGYSNSSRLINFPFSEIKFDKSLVFAAIESKRNETILSHLMGMVKESTLKVLAEGVETEEMSNLVKELGGDYIQGWFYAKSMPLDKFVECVARQNKIKL